MTLIHARLALSAVLALSLSPAVGAPKAPETIAKPQGGSAEQSARFERQKSQAALAQQKRLASVERQLACVQAARASAELEACRERAFNEQKQWRQEIKAGMRERQKELARQKAQERQAKGAQPPALRP